MTRSLLLSIVLTGALLASACGGKDRNVATPVGDVPAPSGPLTSPRESAPGASQNDSGASGQYMRPSSVDETGAAESVLRTVYFDFDRSDIRSDQGQVLDGNARWLLDHPEQRVLIEGHCDERGTVEYNFALGARRAHSVRDFLISRGVPPNQMMVISKGEEEPAVMGTGEEAWRQNRRAEFKFAN